MIIQGDEIILRAIEAEDNELLLSLVNDPETEIMIGGYSWPISKTNQERWFEKQIDNTGNIMRCIIALKRNNQPIGTIILSDIDQKNGTAEIHIKISNNGYRGKGYGADAIKTIVDYAHNELRLNCIYSTILDYNEASIRLFEKCGFRREGILRARVYKGGRYIDQISYSITKE